MNYIGREFTSMDGHKCVIIEDTEPNSNKIPSNRKYKVEFEDGTQGIFNYCSLRVGQFMYKNCVNLKNYIGREFTSIDGHKCKIIEDTEVNSNKMPSERKYKVEFEDGVQGIFLYFTLLYGRFAYKSCVDCNYYIGKEFISRDGYKCKIIEAMRINSNNKPSERKYKVEFEDKTQGVFAYSSLRNSDFSYKNCINYIGREFTSIDGHKCKIIEDTEVNSNKMPCERKYKVEFEDGVQGIFNYYSLRKGVFLYKNCTYIGREFISKDGYRCKIIEDMEFNSNKMPSERKYKVKFDNGCTRILSYGTLSVGEFNAVPEEFIANNIKVNDLYRCTCSLCNYKTYLTVDEMVEHLRKRHNLYNN